MIYCDIDLTIFSLSIETVDYWNSSLFLQAYYSDWRRKYQSSQRLITIINIIYRLNTPSSGTVPKIAIGHWPITIFSFMSPLEPPNDRDSGCWMSWTVRWWNFCFTILPQKVIRFMVEICGVVVLWTRPQLIVLTSLSVVSCDGVCFCVSGVLLDVIQK